MRKGTDGEDEAESAREVSKQHKDCVVELIKQKADIEVTTRPVSRHGVS